MQVFDVANEDGRHLSLVDGGELDEILAAVAGAVGSAGQLVEAAHDAVHLDLAVVAGVDGRLELQEKVLH